MVDWLKRDSLSYADKIRAAQAYVRGKGHELGYDNGGDHLIAAADFFEQHERYLRTCIAMRREPPRRD